MPKQDEYAAIAKLQPANASAQHHLQLPCSLRMKLNLITQDTERVHQLPPDVTIISLFRKIIRQKVQPLAHNWKSHGAAVHT